MAEFLGGGLSESVQAQLQARGKILSKKYRSPEDVRYLTQQTGWVRATSCVNTLSDEDVEANNTLAVNNAQATPPPGQSGPPNYFFDAPRPGSSWSAERMILQGGTVALSSDKTVLQARQGVGFAQQAAGRSNAAYDYDSKSEVGIRPMPGITGFKIRSKNRFGTIREASLNFTVWTREDLDFAEMLYFRPGYSIIIEWGHTVYVDNDGDVQTIGLTPNYSEFFRGNVGRDKLQEIITAYKERTSNNYDALVGYIKNFEWSFRSDGGYDCTIYVTAFGELLESLDMNRTPSPEALKEIQEKQKEEDHAKVISWFHYLNSKLIETSITKKDIFFRDLTGIAPEFVKKVTQTLEEANTNSVLVAALPVNHAKAGKRTWWLGRAADTEYNYYMTLRTFLGIINAYYMLEDPTKSFEHPGRYLTRFNTNPEVSSRIATYSGHYSADPTVCLIPDPPSEFSVTAANLQNRLRNQYVQTEGISDRENIYNIAISTQYLEGILDTILDANGSFQGNSSVLDFVQRVLDGIEPYLGGINNFDIAYDESANLHMIVDRSVTPKRDVVPEINITGIKTTASQLELNTKISNKLGSQLAIAAQSGKSLYNASVAHYLKWNENLVDRVYVARDQGDTVVDAQEKLKKFEEDEKRFVELIGDTYTAFNVETRTDNYSEEAFAAFLGYSLNRQKNAYEAEQVSTSSPEGIIPVDFSMKLDGIGGLKIGQSFRVNRYILPSKYDRFGFIITGLEHMVEGSKWFTVVTAQTYYLG